VGAERDLPYERPPLSKEYFSGEKSFEQILIRPPAFYEESNIEFCLGMKVESVEPDHHRVHLSDGTSVSYGSLVWAAGGSPRKLACPGKDLPHVYAVRTRADVDWLRSRLPGLNDAILIGGGYIGLEIAAVMRKLGKRVTIVEAQDRVLARVAGEPLARFYEAEHRRRGVVVRLQEQVESIEEGHDRRCAVRLASGERLSADAVIVGIGIAPESGPLEAAGVECGNGVNVDEFCRTSIPDIFAVGDVACHRNRYSAAEWIRIESVQNAADQAATVARYLASTATPYDSVPWFWSSQYDLRLQTVGLSQGFDNMLVRGDMASRRFSAIYLRNGRVIALDCVNQAKDYVQGRLLVASGANPDPALLVDTSVALKSLLD